MKRLLYLFLLCWFSYPLLAKDSVRFERELAAFVNEYSEKMFLQYLEDKKVVTDYKGWKTTIDQTFAKLMLHSGFPSFVHTYKIIQDSTFHANAYPAGQFIIHTKVLQRIDEEIAKQKQHTLSNSKFREYYLAGILAHELAHVYNRHTFESYKKVFAAKDKQSPQFSLGMIRFRQQQELEADKTGYLLLQKAGYDPAYLVKILKLLNQIYQAMLKEPGVNPYFLSHPSPNKRLSAILHEERDFYSFLGKMEIVFANIQLGIRLKEALLEVARGLLLYPKNLDLLRAKAVCLHKLWQQSASLDELQLRAILELPSFRNAMLHPPTTGSKSVDKQIPGNFQLFKKALFAYKAVRKYAQDPYFLSNYASLLAYSPRNKDERKARLYGEQALAATIGDAITANNLGVIYFLTGQKQKALGLFYELAMQIDTKLKKYLQQNTSYQNRTKPLKLSYALSDIAKRKYLNKRFVRNNTTPILNLALLLSYLSPKSEELPFIANAYFSYETSSDWAKFLSNSVPISLKTRTKTYRKRMSIKNLSLGNSLQTTLKKWGKPKRRKSFAQEQIWYYDRFSAKVRFHHKKVTSIALAPSSNLGIRKNVAIGTPVNTLQKFSQQRGERQDNYRTFYFSQSKVTVYSQQGKIKSIWLYR
ncbi:MAG: M48 family metalloprotease [Spirochaetota bacterium]